MSDKEFDALQDPEEWDFERVERRPAVKGARAVVSVAFAREDFERVSECAERLQKRTSEFIREAALEKVGCYNRAAVVATFTASLGSALFTHTPLPTTRVSGSASQLGESVVTA